MNIEIFKMPQLEESVGCAKRIAREKVILSKPGKYNTDDNKRQRPVRAEQGVSVCWVQVVFEKEPDRGKGVER